MIRTSPSRAPSARIRDRKSAARVSTWLGKLAILFLLAIASLPAAAQEWRYRVRPGDTVWDLAHKYVRPELQWEQLQAHNRIEDPLRLVPGSVMLFPVAWLRQQPAHARVVAVSGAAQASPRGDFSDATAVTEGLRLSSGAALRTPADASLTLEFADGSRLQLHGDSELHLDRLSAYGTTGMVDTRLRMPRGRASNKVQRSRGPGSGYVIETPGMMSSVRGTEFRVGSDGARSRSEVVAGDVQVSGGGGSVRVRAGRGTVAGPDGRPIAPVTLLPGPDLSAWPRDIQRMPATVQWPPVTGARSYRLQASMHADFRTLLQDTLVDGAAATLGFRSEGEVFLRVRAIDGNGLEGLDSVAAVVVAAQPAPPFAIAPESGGDAVGPRPRLRWTGAEQDGLRYRVEVDGAGGDFSAPQVSVRDLRRNELRTPALAPGHYVWRVGATDGHGRDGPWSDPQPFTLHPPGAGPEVEASSADGVLQVRWRKGDEGQRYHFQLARKPTFEDVVVDRVLDNNAIELSDLRAGTWYMRVSAVDSDDYAHPFGPVQVAKVGCLPCRVLAGAGGVVLVLLAL